MKILENGLVVVLTIAACLVTGIFVGRMAKEFEVRNDCLLMGYTRVESTVIECHVKGNGK